ncbi:MAG: hypothetical protein GWP91_03770, partial [Rhodobacterales bacterium]|nr:hypothetical protein [Rhodobacterales bacterium]
MTRSLLTAAFLCTLPSLAMAQDDDLPGDALPETESVADDSVAPPPIEEADLLDVGDEPEDLDFEDDEDDSGDLLEDGANGSQARAEGEDTDELYREQQNQLIESSPEDVLTAWEAYLQTYPNSLYQSLIAKHIGEAESEMYGEGISQGSEQKVDMRGLRVPETAMGENLNPATRVKFGFDWGLPEYINLIGDFEYALAPQLSVHAAMRKRYTGWSAEAGARYAFVKSESAGLLITGIGDMRLNVEPGYLGFRPQVGVAKELFG